MCSGGGGSPATIYAPDTGAYGRMAQQQLDLMKSTQSNDVLVKQGQLDAAIRQQQDVLKSLNDVTTARANDTSAYAARLAALMGAPPPEKAAKAPVIGTDRAGQSRATGKKSLRIERSMEAFQGAGSGLNITTGGT
jgi:hypothetical protein